MIVTFAIAWKGALIEEAELPAWLSQHAAELGAGGNQDGMLGITAPGQERPLRMFDLIGPLMQSVCIGVPACLLEAGECDVSLYTVDADYRFGTEGEDVVIAGPGARGLRIARNLLLPGLVACAQRYAAVMRPFQDRIADLPDFLDGLEAGAQSCVDLLQAAGLPPS